MKRLTERDNDGFIWTGVETNCENGSYDIWDTEWLDNALNRLADIEDILGDEYDFEDLRKALWCKKIVEDAFSDDPQAAERLRMLWFADQKGHCVVFDEHYPVVSEYYQDEEGRYIRESSGVISEAEYKAAKGEGG